MKSGKNTFLIVLISMLVLMVLVALVSRIPPDEARRAGVIPAPSRHEQTPSPTIVGPSSSSPTVTHSRPTVAPTATRAGLTASPTATRAGLTASPTTTPARPTVPPTTIPTSTPAHPTATATAVRAATIDITPTQSAELTSTPPLLAERVATVLGQPERGSWQIITDSDLNRDEEDVEIVAYQPAILSLDPSFSDPVYQGCDLLVTAFAVLQEQHPDDLRVLLHSTTERISLGEDAEPFEFEDQPAAFLVKIAPRSRIPLTIIPVNDKGQRMMPSIGLTWSVQHTAFRFVLSARSPEP